jgi:elongation factor Ts
MPGSIASYVHNEGALAALVELRYRESTTVRTEAFQALARDLAMHIVAMHPVVVKPSQLDRHAWSERLASLSSQLQQLPPQERLPQLERARTDYERSFCLLKQPFVKGSGATVEEHLAEVSSQLSERIEVVRFVRLEAGEHSVAADGEA